MLAGQTLKILSFLRDCLGEKVYSSLLRKKLEYQNQLAERVLADENKAPSKTISFFSYKKASKQHKYIAWVLAIH